MPSLDDVYKKFGETSEAAQLLETALANILLVVGGVERNLFTGADPVGARDFVTELDTHTLGRLITHLKTKVRIPDELEGILSAALLARNCLSHSFYRKHNFRRNSEEGRAIMLEDLDSMHELIIAAFKAVSLISGTDLDSIALISLPTRYVPI